MTSSRSWATVSIFVQTGAVLTVRSLQSSQTKSCLTRGLPMVWRVSSFGRSPQQTRGPTYAWSSRASDRISSRPTRAPSTGGSGSLRTWSGSWRGQIEVCRSHAKLAPACERCPSCLAVGGKSNDQRGVQDAGAGCQEGCRQGARGDDQSAQDG